MKKKKNRIVIIAIIIGILVYISPFILIIFGIYIDSKRTDFKVNNDIVYIDGGKITIDNVSSYYNDEDGSYYIIGYAHNNSDKLQVLGKDDTEPKVIGDKVQSYSVAPPKEVKK